MDSLICTCVCNLETFYHVVGWRLAQCQKRSVGMIQVQLHNVSEAVQRASGHHHDQIPKKKSLHLVSAVAALGLIMIVVPRYRYWRATYLARRRMRNLPRFTLPGRRNFSAHSLRSAFSSCSEDAEFRDMPQLQHARHQSHQVQMPQELKQKRKQKKNSKSKNETHSHVHLAIPSSPICLK